MSIATLKEKLTFTEDRTRQHHLTVAKGCREAAKRHPEHGAPLRRKMREHALMARKGVVS